MKASVIDTISACSLLSIEYLTVYSIMAIGPAAEYNSECIRIEWHRVKKPAAALENYTV